MNIDAGIVHHLLLSIDEGLQMAKRTYSTVEALLAEYEDLRPALRFDGSTVEDWTLWRRKMRHALLDVLGVDYSDRRLRTPLEPEVVAEADVSHSIRRKVIFQADANATIIAYLYIPKDAEEPRPVVVALNGHGRGAKDVIGEDDGDPHYAGHIRDDNYNYADQAAARGFVVLAPEQRGWGERREPREIEAQNPEVSSCQVASLSAMLFGKTLVALRAFDVSRCIDYLSLVPEADVARVGCMGLSGGGTVTTYASAVDERIKAACISGFFCTYRGSILAMDHCICNYQPGILRYGEQDDVTGLIAPRPLLIEAGRDDPIFPLEHVQKAYAHLQRIYAAAGAPDALDIDIFEGGHRFSGRKTFDFFARFL
jgi:dienelactone hydrolase